MSGKKRDKKLDEESVDEVELEVETGEDNEVLEEELDELSKEDQVKDEIIDGLKEQLLRLQADFMNFKRRSEEQRSASMDYAVEKFAMDILPCVDNFERALEAGDEEKTSFHEGVYMIYEELLRVLNKNNIEEVEVLGEKFDPNMHHAVFAEENQEYEPETVIEVLQKGYKIKDKIIRPAMVKVSK